eukprot:6546950-Prymnesium_polylepis.2
MSQPTGLFPLPQCAVTLGALRVGRSRQRDPADIRDTWARSALKPYVTPLLVPWCPELQPCSRRPAP